MVRQISMSRINTLLFGVPAVVPLWLPFLRFALGHYLQDHFDFTLSAGSKFFIGDRLRQGADHSNRRPKRPGYSVWKIDAVMTLHVNQ